MINNQLQIMPRQYCTLSLLRFLLLFAVDRVGFSFSSLLSLPRTFSISLSLANAHSLLFLLLLFLLLVLFS